MIIAIGADHGGFKLKEQIREHLAACGHEVTDCGTYDETSCHYPMYAEKVAAAVASGGAELGVLVCGTGIGMSMAANKVRGIRAAVVGDCFSAEATRRHNNANVICLGERVTGAGLALKIVDAFLAAEFEGARHQTRIDMISDIENRNL
ncbi:MAG: ribose 5-phosphate isomerase B [Clostridia bacterium]|nr:ribose 5-phosphate isomerase B [Clostridia bacterium]